MKQRAFAALVLGGFGSMPGAILGGLSIGLVEQFAGVYLPDGFKDVSAQLILVGVLYAAVAAFRYLGGRVKDRETLAGLALYWYFLAAIITVAWYTIYVTK